MHYDVFQKKCKNPGRLTTSSDTALSFSNSPVTLTPSGPYLYTYRLLYPSVTNPSAIPSPITPTPACNTEHFNILFSLSHRLNEHK